MIQVGYVKIVRCHAKTVFLKQVVKAVKMIYIMIQLINNA